MDRKNRRFPFDFDLDEMLGLDIQRIFDEMNEFMLNARNDPEIDEGRPLYYGYSVEVGPDGKPHVQEWGNVRPGGKIDSADRKMIEKADNNSCGCPPEQNSVSVPESDDEGSPYSCCMMDENKNELKIHVDIPGISKEDVNLELKENKLILTAENESRKYHKEIQLEQAVSSRNIKANYNNGVMEITLKCKKPGREKKSKKIEVK
jgi:HSP20 family protein